MRFVYEYVLGNGPTYRSEYQQNRAIVRFIQVLSKLLEDKYTIEQIAEQVFEIFPNIRKAEKRQMMDDAIRWSLPEKEGAYTRYGEKDYTNHRWNLTFLDGRSYEQARENAALLMSREGRKGIFHDRGLQTGTRNCEFCPHSGYCMERISPFSKWQGAGRSRRCRRSFIDPWGKTSKERPVGPAPEPLPVTPSRPVLDVEKFEEWMDQRTLNGYVEKPDGTGIRD